MPERFGAEPNLHGDQPFDRLTPSSCKERSVTPIDAPARMAVGLFVPRDNAASGAETLYKRQRAICHHKILRSRPRPRFSRKSYGLRAMTFSGTRRLTHYCLRANFRTDYTNAHSPTPRAKRAAEMVARAGRQIVMTKREARRVCQRASSISGSEKPRGPSRNLREPQS